MSAKGRVMCNGLATLGKAELIFLLDVIDSSLACRDIGDVKVLLERLANALPTSGMAAGLTPTHLTPSNISQATFLSSGFPDEWMREYERRNYFFCDPVKRERIAGADLQIWSKTFQRAISGEERQFIAHARDYGICEGITVGTRQCSRVSFFSFVGPELPRYACHLTTLHYLAPYLNEAILRANPEASTRAKPPRGLSDREREVLQWTMAGKTNWEISQILSISERTVKFHVQNAMSKLQASTRTHAVAIALNRGLIAL